MGKTDEQFRSKVSSVILRSARGIRFPFFVLTSCLLFFASSAYGVGGDPVWQFRDGGSSGKAGNQTATAMTVDSNGNVIVAGYQKVCSNDITRDCTTDSVCGANNYCNSKFYTIKVDDNGASGSGAWSATLNRCSSDGTEVCASDSDCGSGNSCNVTPPGDQINAIATDSAVSNNVIVAGYIWDGSHKHCTIVKYDGAAGTKSWHYIYGYGGSTDSECSSIAADSANGKIYAGGYTQVPGNGEDALIIKLDLTTGLPDTSFNSSGGTPGTVTYNRSGNNDDRITALALTGSDIVATGWSFVATNDFDYLTLKYTSSTNGAPQWVTPYSSTGGGIDKGVAIKADLSGNVVVTGQTNGNDIYTVKYSGSDGSCLWGYTYDGGGADKATALRFDAGTGDFFVSGYSSTRANGYEFYAARYKGSYSDGSCNSFNSSSDSKGLLVIWEQVTGTGSDDYTVPSDIEVDLKGDVLVSGRTYKGSNNDDWLTVKFNGTNGNVLWQAGFSGAAGKDDQPVGLAFSSPGNLYAAGYSDNGTDYDYYVVKYDPGSVNPPTSLTAAALTNTSIQLAWQDNSTNETSFKVERTLGPPGPGNDYAEIATITSPPPTNNMGAVTFTDDNGGAGLAPNSYYYYRVRASSSTDGYSNYSNEAHALTWVISYGSPLWIYSHDNGGSEDIANGIAVGPDDNPVATGHVGTVTGAGFYTAKLSRALESATCSSSVCLNNPSQSCSCLPRRLRHRQGPP